jgi:hypothetical protein
MGPWWLVREALFYGVKSIGVGLSASKFGVKAS